MTCKREGNVTGGPLDEVCVGAHLLDVDGLEDAVPVLLEESGIGSSEEEGVDTSIGGDIGRGAHENVRSHTQ